MVITVLNPLIDGRKEVKERERQSSLSGLREAQGSSHRGMES